MKRIVKTFAWLFLLVIPFGCSSGPCRQCGYSEGAIVVVVHQNNTLEVFEAPSNGCVEVARRGGESCGSVQFIEYIPS